jgi:ferritin-like metal-binding protein YciE
MPKSKDENLTLRDLLIQKLVVLADIEANLAKALPKLAKAAEDEDLKKAFELHETETQHHLERVQEAIEEISEEKPKKLTSEGIRGVIKDGEWVAKNIPAGPLRDMNLIAAARYAEHYEMAGYRSAILWAEELGFEDLAEVFMQNLKEEEDADGKLSDLARNKIGRKLEEVMSEGDEENIIGGPEEEEEDEEEEEEEGLK